MTEEMEKHSYVTRSRAMAILGRRLYSEERPISLRLLLNLVREGKLKQLEIPAGGEKKKLRRFFIDLQSIEDFLSGNGLQQIA